MSSKSEQTSKNSYNVPVECKHCHKIYLTMVASFKKRYFCNEPECQKAYRKAITDDNRAARHKYKTKLKAEGKDPKTLKEKKKASRKKYNDSPCPECGAKVKIEYSTGGVAFEYRRCKKCREDINRRSEMIADGWEAFDAAETGDELKKILKKTMNEIESGNTHPWRNRKGITFGVAARAWLSTSTSA